MRTRYTGDGDIQISNSKNQKGKRNFKNCEKKICHFFLSIFFWRLVNLTFLFSFTLISFVLDPLFLKLPPFLSKFFLFLVSFSEKWLAISSHKLIWLICELSHSSCFGTKSLATTIGSWQHMW